MLLRWISLSAICLSLLISSIGFSADDFVDVVPDELGELDLKMLEKAKNLSIDKIGAVSRSEKDNELRAALERYGRSPQKFAKEKNRIEDKYFLLECKAYVTQQVQQVHEIAGATLRHKLMQQFMAGMEHPVAAKAFQQQFATRDAQAFYVFFQAKISEQLALQIPLYKRVKEASEQLAANTTFSVSNEAQEKTLRDAVGAFQPLQVKRLFTPVTSTSPMVEGGQDIDVKFQSISDYAVQLLTETPSNRTAWRAGEKQREIERKQREEEEKRLEAVRVAEVEKEARKHEAERLRILEKQERQVAAEERQRLEALRQKQEEKRRLDTEAARVAAEKKRQEEAALTEEQRAERKRVKEEKVRQAEIQAQKDKAEREKARQAQAVKAEQDRLFAVEKEKRLKAERAAKAEQDRLAAIEKEKLEADEKKAKREAQLQAWKSGAKKVAKYAGYVLAAPVAVAASPAIGVGYLGYYGYGKASQAIGAYQANAPVREEARQRRVAAKTQKAQAKAEKRAAETEAQRQAREARETAKRKRTDDWVQLQDFLRTSLPAEEAEWVIHKVAERRKSALQAGEPLSIHVWAETENHNLEPYRQTRNQIEQLHEERRQVQYREGELPELIRQKEVTFFSKLRSHPIEGFPSWEQIKSQRQALAHGATTTYNRKFWSQKRPRELHISSGKEERVWRDIQAKSPKKEWGDAGFVVAVVRQYQQHLGEVRASEKVLELTQLPEGDTQKKEKIVPVKKNPTQQKPITLSKELFAVYDNLLLLEQGSEYLRTIFIPSYQSEEVTKSAKDVFDLQMKAGLWETFLQLRQTRTDASSVLAQQAWDRVQKKRESHGQVNTLDFELAYQDRFDQLQSAQPSVPMGKASSKSSLQPAQTVILTLDPEKTKKEFAEHTYSTFPPQISFFFDQTSLCNSCGESVHFVRRPLSHFGLRKTFSTQWVQVPLPGTHKLSTCGHLICDDCMQGWKKQKLLAVEDYACPNCREKIPYWETNQEKWDSHFGMQYGKVAIEGTPDFSALRKEELALFQSDLEGRLKRRLAGEGLEIGGIFYRKIASKHEISEDEQSTFWKSWNQEVVALTPTFSEDQNANLELYTGAWKSLEAVYVKHAAKLAWALYQPSVENRAMQHQLAQYEFSAPTESIDSKDVYQKMVQIESESKGKYLEEIHSRWKHATVESAESFRWFHLLGGVKEVWDSLHVEFQGKIRKELALYQGSKAYHEKAYAALKEYAHHSLYNKTDSNLVGEDKTQILPIFEHDLRLRVNGQISGLAQEIEAENQRISTLYQKLSAEDETKSTSFIQEIETGLMKVTQEISTFKKDMQVRIEEMHWRSVVLDAIENTRREASELSERSKPKTPDFMMMHSDATAEFFTKTSELCSLFEFNLQNQSELTLIESESKRLIADLTDQYRAIESRYTLILSPYLDTERLATETQDQLAVYGKLLDSNRTKLSELQKRKDTKFASQYALIERRWQKLPYVDDKPLVRIKEEVKKQEEIQKNLVSLSTWEKYSFESDLNQKRNLFWDVLAYLANPTLQGTSPSVAKIWSTFHKKSQELYENRLHRASLIRNDTEYCAEYEKQREEFELDFHRFMVRNTEWFLADHMPVGYVEWKQNIARNPMERIQDILEEIGSERTRSMLALQHRLLTYVGSYLLEYPLVRGDELVRLYEQKRMDMEPQISGRFSAIPIISSAEPSGLPNFGATCYLNSIYQSFASTKLYELLLPTHAVGVLARGETLQKELYKIVNSIRSGVSLDVLTPMAEEANQMIWRVFSHVDQVTQDQIPLHLIHRDITEYLRPILEVLNGDSLLKGEEYSMISNLVEGTTSLNEKPFTLLPLDLSDRSLPGILAQRGQIRTAYGADEKPTHHMWDGFSELPKVLMISLSRFSYLDGVREKRKDRVSLPLELPVTGRHVKKGAEGNGFRTTYRLAGIYLHYEGEGLQTGHYTFVTPLESTYLERDDTNIVNKNGASFMTFVEENAYVVMYVKQEGEAFSEHEL